MGYKVGINGFGRIGKLVYKILRKRGIDVPIVNDPALDVSYMYYLLKYDSTFGKDANVTLEADHVMYNGKPSVLTEFMNPSEIPWKKYGVDYVVEATGIFKTVKECEQHKDIKKVVITAPSSDAPMFVCGVNTDKYNQERIISNASCTTNCLAPLANLINKHFGIEEGLMTTIHSVTASQKLVDGVAKKSRRDGRSGLQNIIPASTGAALAVGKVIPDLNNKLNGMAMRVPLPDVSVVDLTVRLNKSTTLKEIKKAIEQECKENPKIFGIVDDDVVSSDFLGDERSCIFDYKASMQMSDRFFKLIAWYDNEYAYSCRVVDLLDYIHK